MDKKALEDKKSKNWNELIEKLSQVKEMNKNKSWTKKEHAKNYNKMEMNKMQTF